MPKVINLGLMSNPLNWATLTIWLFAGAMVLAASGITTAPSKKSANTSSN